jgi:hypothetical protein
MGKVKGKRKEEKGKREKVKGNKKVTIQQQYRSGHRRWRLSAAENV